ncbi:MAG: hypothetical protein AAGG75_25995, partial [Bacteroidota bacterium]
MKQTLCSTLIACCLLLFASGLDAQCTVTFDTCPGDQTLIDCDGDGMVIFTWTLPTASSSGAGCNPIGPVVLGGPNPPTDTLMVGTSVSITYDALDLMTGATASPNCTFILTALADTEPPVPMCNTAQDVPINAACDEITIPDLTGESYLDNGGECDPHVTVTQVPEAGTAAATTAGGTTDVVVTFTDASGNAATCTVTLTAIDVTAPVFDCTTLTQVDFTTNPSSTCTNDMDVAPPVATDACDGAVTAVGTRDDNAAIDAPWELGTTVITWTFTDAAGNETECTQDVVVVDDVDPIIDCNSLDPISFNTDPVTDCTNDTDVSAPVATDNCDGTVTAVGMRNDNAAIDAPWPLGTTIITWTFTDAAGNDIICMQDVVVEDNVDPVFDCSSLMPINLNPDPVTGCTNDTDAMAPVATDNCDGMITAVGMRDDNAAIDAPWPLGTTVITWTFTDASNNVTTC